MSIYWIWHSHIYMDLGTWKNSGHRLHIVSGTWRNSEFSLFIWALGHGYPCYIKLINSNFIRNFQASLLDGDVKNIILTPMSKPIDLGMMYNFRELDSYTYGLFLAKLNQATLLRSGVMGLLFLVIHINKFHFFRS